MKPAQFQFIQKFIVGLMVLFFIQAMILTGAVFWNDYQINRNHAFTTAEVITVSSIRATVSFYTESGENQNPIVGVLYPTKLEKGQLIKVEYDKTNPNLVKVAGRSASLALRPIAFWWMVFELGLMVILVGNAINYNYRYMK